MDKNIFMRRLCIEIIRPNVRSIADIKRYKEENLLDYLSKASELTKLSNLGINGIQKYYEFASSYSPSAERKPFKDHGITSSLFILLQNKYNSYFAKKILSQLKKLESRSLPTEILACIKDIADVFTQIDPIVVEAANAVAIHNISYKLWESNDTLLNTAESEYRLTLHDFIIDPETFPLGFLLTMTDTIQDWDRPTFKMPSQSEISDHQLDQDISITLDDEKIYIAYPKETVPSEKFRLLEKELKLRIKPEFIDDIFSEIKWDAIGEFKITPQAKAIEKEPFNSAHFSSDKIAELLSYGKKQDHLEYYEYLNFRNDTALLKLIKHIVAIANTGGGYIMVGIKDNPFTPIGIDYRTTQTEFKNIAEFVSLYCSSSVGVFLENIKKLFTDEKGKREFKSFLTFYIQKNSALIAFTKDGIVKGSSEKVFNKNEIYYRENSKTVLADSRYIKNKFVEAKLCNENELVHSIIALYKNGSIEIGLDMKGPIPGKLPQADYDRLIGRDTDVNEVLEFINNPKVFSLTIDGVGGSGKSALALEVARNIKNGGYSSEERGLSLKEKFEAVVWVSAKSCELTADGITPKFDSSLTLEILFDVIADSINFPELKNLEFFEKKSDIIEFLKTTSCLIFIDNLETIPNSHKEEIISFLELELPPPSMVIYTTRSKFHGGYSKRVMELGPEDAVFLSKILCIDLGNQKLAQDEKMMRNVAERTGYIPIGIKWVISRLNMGYEDSLDVQKIINNSTLISFCFEETFKHLIKSESLILLSIAMCKFISSKDSIEFITELDPKTVKKGIRRLESFSLVKINDGKFYILPLTRDYCTLLLEKNLSLKNKFQNKLKKLSTLNTAVTDSLPIGERLALKLYKEAVYDEANDNLHEAKNKLKEALELSRSGYILKALGALYERMKKPKEAIALLTEFVKENPEDVDILKKIGYLCMEHNDSKNALHYFTEYLSKTGYENKIIFFHKGNLEVDMLNKVNHGSGKYQKYNNDAINSYKMAITEKSVTRQEKHKNSSNYYNIVRCHLRVKNYMAAKENWKNGMAENPENKGLLQIGYSQKWSTFNM